MDPGSVSGSRSLTWPPYSIKRLRPWATLRSSWETWQPLTDSHNACAMPIAAVTARPTTEPSGVLGVMPCTTARTGESLYGIGSRVITGAWGMVDMLRRLVWPLGTGHPILMMHTMCKSDLFGRMRCARRYYLSKASSLPPEVVRLWRDRRPSERRSAVLPSFSLPWELRRLQPGERLIRPWQCMMPTDAVSQRSTHN